MSTQQIANARWTLELLTAIDSALTSNGYPDKREAGYEDRMSLRLTRALDDLKTCRGTVAAQADAITQLQGDVVNIRRQRDSFETVLRAEQSMRATVEARLVQMTNNRDAVQNEAELTIDAARKELVALRQEVANWKADIASHRDQIRRAEAERDDLSERLHKAERENVGAAEVERFRVHASEMQGLAERSQRETQAALRERDELRRVIADVRESLHALQHIPA